MAFQSDNPEPSERTGTGGAAWKSLQVGVPAVAEIFLADFAGEKRPSDSEARMEAKNNSRIGAVILAAGTSSRMGEPKQLLRLGETTLLDQVVENVRGSQVDEIVIVLGHQAETIKERI